MSGQAGRWKKGCGIACGAAAALGLALAVTGVFVIRRLFFRPMPAAPSLPANVALRPMFLIRGGTPYGAGTAVAVRLQPGGRPILLTAEHLFGPAAGQTPPIPPSQLNARVAGVLLSIIGRDAPIGGARGSLRNSGAFPHEDMEDVRGDVAAFFLNPNSKVAVLPLAPRTPRWGEWLWLVGDVFDHVPQQQRLFPGRVTFASEPGVRVRFRAAFPKRAFSGAPLVDAHGEVAGILIGGNDRIAVINPAGAIRRTLQGLDQRER